MAKTGPPHTEGEDYGDPETVVAAKHGQPVVVAVSVEEHQGPKLLDTPGTRTKMEKQQ